MYYIIKPNIIVLSKRLSKIWKSKVFWMAAIMNIAKKEPSLLCVYTLWGMLCQAQCRAHTTTAFVGSAACCVLGNIGPVIYTFYCLSVEKLKVQTALPFVLN